MLRPLAAPFFLPAIDHRPRLLLSAAEFKSADQPQGIDRISGHKDIAHSQRSGISPRLGNHTTAFGKLLSRFAQKILHRRFVVKLIEVGALPGIAIFFHVRNVNKTNSVGRKKNGDAADRSCAFLPSANEKYDRARRGDR